jgi:hypothetical protein
MQLMDGYMRINNAGMARPKKFAERTVLSFPADTFDAITRLAGESEDRSAFIRTAVELEIALRSLDGYDDLKAHLLANESIADFCLKAITRAVAQRKAALAGDLGETSKAQGA